MIYYEMLREVSGNDADDIRQLLNQLSSSSPALTAADVNMILNQPQFILLVARDGQRIVGMASLWWAEILMGKKAFIDDVVVLGSYRGRGIGERLIKEFILFAKSSAKANSVELTSNPNRAAANALYQKLGFQKRDTNVYRLTF